MSDEPRQYTQAEMMLMFLNHLKGIRDYWLNEDRRPDTADKMDGLCFSFLSMLDGSSIDIPAMEIVPTPHPGDAEYLKDEGENWWPDQSERLHESGFETIHGPHALHELWHYFCEGKLTTDKDGNLVINRN